MIAELELLPILIFFEQYQVLCKRRRILLFVDNNAVRDIVAKASSRSLTLLVLLSELHRLWARIQCMCWVSRVPTKSNISDYPSRQRPEQAAEIIQGKCLAALEPSDALCRMICNSTSFTEHMRNLLKNQPGTSNEEKKGGM